MNFDNKISIFLSRKLLRKIQLVKCAIEKAKANLISPVLSKWTEISAILKLAEGVRWARRQSEREKTYGAHRQILQMKGEDCGPHGKQAKHDAQKEWGEYERNLHGGRYRHFHGRT